jgi:carbamate kinase
MRFVLSIGGNALHSIKDARRFAEIVCRLRKKGQVIITHGNGPQVGMLADLERGKRLGILTAQTEAEIGLYLKDAIIKRSREEGRKYRVCIILTEVAVARNDPRFTEYTKPIGSYSTSARKVGRGIVIRRFAMGFRRVVPSPLPIRIENQGMLESAINDGCIVIAGGGGGIPRIDGTEELAEAVIDKDHTSALIGTTLGAKRLFIFTDVDGAYTGFGKKGNRRIGRINAAGAQKLMDAGEFGEGDMRPKVEACIKFARETGGIATIGNISKAEAVVRLEGCTVIF